MDELDLFGQRGHPQRRRAGGKTLWKHRLAGLQVNSLVERQGLDLRQREIDRGLTDLATFRAFAERVKHTKWNLLEFLIQAKRDGKSVAAYGAPGKAATLLNYCGIREDLIQYTVDRNKMKQNTFQVGTLIPIYAPEMIYQTKPDYILILPWNLKDEIMGQMAHAREWGAKFVVPIPELTVY